MQTIADKRTAICAKLIFTLLPLIALSYTGYSANAGNPINAYNYPPALNACIIPPFQWQPYEYNRRVRKLELRQWYLEGRIPEKNEIEAECDWEVIDSILHGIVTRAQDEHPLDILYWVAHLMKRWEKLTGGLSRLSAAELGDFITLVQLTQKAPLLTRREYAKIYYPDVYEYMLRKVVGWEGAIAPPYNSPKRPGHYITDPAYVLVQRFLEIALYQVNIQARRLADERLRY